MMKTLNEKEWVDFELQKIANIDSGRDIYAQERIEGKTPYITSGAANNGIGYFVGNDNKSKAKNSISVNRNGAVGEAFYHSYEALYGNDCRRVTLHSARTKNTQLFLVRSIANQRKVFSYSRKLGTKRLRKLHIMLPVANSGEPDYDYMSDYVQEQKETMLAKYHDYLEKQIAEIGDYVEIPALNEKRWGEFSAFGKDGFFEIAASSSSIDGIRIVDGDNKNVPYITRTDTNNGIARYVSDKNYKFGYDKAGCITVGLDTQTAYWQSSDFVTGQNIQIITGDILNHYTAQFIIPMLRSQMRAKFNWGGNGATLGRMKRLKLLLPVTADGKPDFEYMEQYIKNLMLKKYEQYLLFKK